MKKSIKQSRWTAMSSRLGGSASWLGLVLACIASLALTAEAQHPAAATATVLNGSVIGITVTDGGSGYPEPPVVTLVGGDGIGATASAQVANGAVTQIAVLTSGTGYTVPPEVVISVPPADPTALDLQLIPLVTLHGLIGDTNQIEATTTLVDGAVWVPLTTVVLTNNVQEWYDRISAPGARRYYRAVLLGTGNRPTPGLRFVWLPAGQFVMGSPATEPGRSENEGPQTLVKLTRGFYLGRYEVTQGEYLGVTGSNPSSYSGDTNRPVDSVSWFEATNYCTKLTAIEYTAGRLPAGWAYRLPTEAEWEYASRAGSTNRFSYGNDPDYAQLGNYAWFDGNSGAVTHAGGEKLPNRWGLYDMYGNVWEWCSDWYGALPGGAINDPRGPSDGTFRVNRGGSWETPAYNCRSAVHSYGNPTSQYHGFGFRVVLAPKQP